MKLFVSVSLLLLLVVTAGAGGGYWWWTVGSIPMPVRLCEERVLQMLKSPTSYQRASYKLVQTEHDYAREDFLNAQMEIDRYKEVNQLVAPVIKYDPIEARKSMEVLLVGVDDFYKRIGFTKILVDIEFDAKNPMGALLRSHGYCKWVKTGKGPEMVTWSHIDAGEAGLFLLPR